MPAQMMIMPIVTWRPYTSTFSGAVGHVMGMSAGIYQRLGNMFSSTTKRALGSNPTHSARRGDGRKSDSSSDSILSDEDSGQQKNWKRRRRMIMKSLVPPLMRLAWMSLILSRVPPQASLLLVQTLACHPTSLGVDYQGTARCSHIKVFMMFVFY